MREGTLLSRAFHIMPEYLQDTAVGGVEVNFADRGVQLTRSARALKLWLSLQAFGVDAFREAIDRSLDLAVLAEQRIEASDGARAPLARHARDRLLPPHASRRRGRRARSSA